MKDPEKEEKERKKEEKKKKKEEEHKPAFVEEFLNRADEDG